MKKELKGFNVGMPRSLDVNGIPSITSRRGNSRVLSPMFEGVWLLFGFLL